jgi:hypothetical protein
MYLRALYVPISYEKAKEKRHRHKSGGKRPVKGRIGLASSRIMALDFTLASIGI